MAVTATVYGQFLLNLAEKKINLSADTLNVMLVSSSYTPNADTDAFESTPQADEISGAGYTAGGQALTGVALTYNATTHMLQLAANNVSWTSATFTARYAVLYDSTPGAAASNPLIGWVDFGGNQSPAGVTFEIDWASGIVLEIPQ